MPQPITHQTICQTQRVGMPKLQLAGSLSLPRTANGPMAPRNQITVTIQAGAAHRRVVAFRPAWLRKKSWNRPRWLRPDSSMVWVKALTMTVTPRLQRIPQPAL